ncbi:hypothetical protein LXL04_039875 [Taraxacum kok-saghyz]
MAIRLLHVILSLASPRKPHGDDNSRRQAALWPSAVADLKLVEVAIEKKAGKMIYRMRQSPIKILVVVSSPPSAARLLPPPPATLSSSPATVLAVAAALLEENERESFTGKEVMVAGRARQQGPSQRLPARRSSTTAVEVVRNLDAVAGVRTSRRKGTTEH